MANQPESRSECGTMQAIRIVLAEDHTLVREGTRRILEQFPDLLIVGDASDGLEALEAIRHLQPDVAVLDIRLPRLSGIEILRAVGEASSQTKVLMLTAHDEDEYVLAAMDAGACGYLLKTAEPAELVNAIRAVYRGESVLAPAITVKVARLWSRRWSASGKDFEPLTPREQEVLSLAAQGLRNAAIAERLVLSVRTVEGHLTTVFGKLRVSSRTEAVLYALSRGLIRLSHGDAA